MKATNQFVSRTTSDGSFVKVKLNHDHNVYSHEYKGVNFFVYRDPWYKLWYGIESRSGSSIAEDHRTKKECVKHAHRWIDDTKHIAEIVQTRVDTLKSAKMVSQDEYDKRR